MLVTTAVVRCTRHRVADRSSARPSGAVMIFAVLFAMPRTLLRRLPRYRSIAHTLALVFAHPLANKQIIGTRLALNTTRPPVNLLGWILPLSRRKTEGNDCSPNNHKAMRAKERAQNVGDGYSSGRKELPAREVGLVCTPESTLPSWGCDRGWHASAMLRSRSTRGMDGGGEQGGRDEGGEAIGLRATAVICMVGRVSVFPRATIDHNLLICCWKTSPRPAPMCFSSCHSLMVSILIGEN